MKGLQSRGQSFFHQYNLKEVLLFFIKQFIVYNDFTITDLLQPKKFYSSIHTH